MMASLIARTMDGVVPPDLSGAALAKALSTFAGTGQKVLLIGTPDEHRRFGVTGGLNLTGVTLVVRPEDPSSKDQLAALIQQIMSNGSLDGSVDGEVDRFLEYLSSRNDFQPDKK